MLQEEYSKTECRVEIYQAAVCLLRMCRGGMPSGGMGSFFPFGDIESPMNITEITLSQEDANNLKESIPEKASAPLHINFSELSVDFNI